MSYCRTSENRCGMWASQGNERGNEVKVTWASPASATAGQVVQKLTVHNQKLIQKNFDRFTSIPNSHGTFWDIHININFKVNISEINRPIKLEFCMLSILKSNIFSIKIIKFWQLIPYINFKIQQTQSQCPLILLLFLPHIYIPFRPHIILGINHTVPSFYAETRL